jgi:hypothetical protein
VRSWQKISAIFVLCNKSLSVFLRQKSKFDSRGEDSATFSTWAGCENNKIVPKMFFSSSPFLDLSSNEIGQENGSC